MERNNKKPSTFGEEPQAVSRAAQKDVSSELSSNPEFRRIASWLSGVKFKKKTLCGLDPVDVWKKIEELNRLYENALIAERVRYDMQMEQAKQDTSLHSVLGTAIRERDENG